MNTRSFNTKPCFNLNMAIVREMVRKLNWQRTLKVAKPFFLILFLPLESKARKTKERGSSLLFAIASRTIFIINLYPTMMKIRFCPFKKRWYKKNSHVYTHTHTDTHASLWRTGHVLLDRWFRKAGGESQAGWWPRGGQIIQCGPLIQFISPSHSLLSELETDWGGGLQSRRSYADHQQPSGHKAELGPWSRSWCETNGGGSYSRHAALFPHLGDKTHPPSIDPLPLVQIANDLPLASHPIMYPVSQHQLLRQIAAPAGVRGGYVESLSLDSFLNPSSPSCLFSRLHIGPFQFQV